MRPRRPTCPDCREPMERGYSPDWNLSGAAVWIEGAPETSALATLKTRGRALRPIVSWRCPACGLLREYAVAPGEG